MQKWLVNAQERPSNLPMLAQKSSEPNITAARVALISGKALHRALHMLLRFIKPSADST